MNFTFKSAESKRALGHLELCGVSRPLAVLLMTQISVWERNNGPEWTVSRLKDIKTWFVQSLSGSADYSAPWIAKKYKNGSRPKGHFGVLWNAIQEGASSKKVIKALSSLMVYTSYKGSKVTRKQYSKTVGSICSTDVLPKDVVVKLTSLGENCSRNFVGEKKLKWFFHPAGLNTGKPRTWSQFKYLESFIMGLNTPHVGAYLERKGDLPSCLAAPLWGDDRSMLSPGNISIIQERGYKPRVVAMPHASIQVALYPLHRLLDGILRDWPTDCTHNQEAGAMFAHQKLKEGQPVYSVDLSGATDNFPRSFQIGVLKGLGLDEEAELIESLSSSEWKLSYELESFKGDQYVRYTKGQPQGMYSSFPLFGLSHNLLVRWMCKDLGLVPEDSFRILGDDIVIADERLHNQYRKVMKSMKVPISEDKSLQSQELAEFAGYIISPKGYWKPAKVPNSSVLESNFVNYLKVTGHQGLKSLPAASREIARIVLELPEELGGLGQNPYGKSLDERSSHLVSSETDLLAIPKFYGIHSTLPAAKLDWFLSEGAVYLEWLNDQFNLFDTRLTAMLADVDKNLLKGISEPRALAYQLSILMDVEGKPNMQTMVGNMNKDMVPTSSFESDFSKWSKLLKSRGQDSLFVKMHSKDSHETINRITKKWNLSTTK